MMKSSARQHLIDQKYSKKKNKTKPKQF